MVCGLSAKIKSFFKLKSTKQMKTIKDNETLTYQQQRFCDEYLVCFNAYKAALNAGYSESMARKAELLHLPKIKAYIERAMAQTGARLQISHDMILRELAKVAFASMGDYYNEHGVLIPMNQLTPDQRAAIQQYQVLDADDGQGNQIDELSRVKLHNKMVALDRIARHTGFYLNGTKSKEQGVRIGVMEDAAVMEDGRGKMEDVVGNDLPVTAMDEDLLADVVASERRFVKVSPDGRDDIMGVGEAEKAENILTISPLWDGIKRKEQAEGVESTVAVGLMGMPCYGDGGGMLQAAMMGQRV
jgi:phage terminase small subunit